MNDRHHHLARAALIACLLGLAAPTLADSYPKLGLYGSIMGNGYPLWDAGGALVPAALDQIARYDEVILDASPITPYRPDAIAALRQRNPNITLLAYVLGHNIWYAADPDSFVHYPTRYWRLVRDLNGFLYNRAGQLYPGVDVNLAKRDGTGRLVVAEGLADLFHDAIVSTGLWDGIFIDVYCRSVLWSQTPSDSIDFARAGYASASAFDAAWAAGTDTIADRLRRISGPTQVLVGNCATSSHFASLNGWMRENFPYQNGGTWYDNVTKDPGGYLTDDARFRAPPHNYIFSAVQGSNPLDLNNARKVRFGLGSAALGEGFGTFGPSDRSVMTAPYHQWWYDEYAVDVQTGASSTQLQHTGWLGAAIGPPYQMVWVGTNPDACSNPDFETSATSGWNFWHSTVPAASLSRDTGTSASGAASAHINIPTPSAVDWQITLSSQGSISMIPGQSYSATFWAKASTPRTFTVAAGYPTGGGSYATSRLAIGTTWKRYQVVLIPGSSGSASLQFFLGLTAGDVWFDDVHFQYGVTGIYRRDFQNGIVLVNPSPGPLTVPLGATFRKILGTVSPTVNDGSSVSQVTVGASDALFLLGSDTTPPAAINDLRPQP